MASLDIADIILESSQPDIIDNYPYFSEGFYDFILSDEPVDDRTWEEYKNDLLDLKRRKKACQPNHIIYYYPVPDPDLIRPYKISSFYSTIFFFIAFCSFLAFIVIELFICFYFGIQEQWELNFYFFKLSEKQVNRIVTILLRVFILSLIIGMCVSCYEVTSSGGLKYSKP